MGDLPPSYTEEEIRTLVETETGVQVLYQPQQDSLIS